LLGRAGLVVIFLPASEKAKNGFMGGNIIAKNAKPSEQKRPQETESRKGSGSTTTAHRI
jgi:hypothetical protein